MDKTANLRLAAKRIVFGKFLNCGQTCVAPDYIYCDPEIKEALVAELRRQITRQYGKEALKNRNYGKIINEKHFDRINSLIDPSKTVCGGGSNRETLQIEPTVLDNVTFEDPVMQQEIFGPVLPVLTYDSLGGAVTKINSMAHPLALYIFTEDEKNCPGSYFPMWFSAVAVSTMSSYIWQPAIWASAALVKAAWDPIMASTASGHSLIIRVL